MPTNREIYKQGRLTARPTREPAGAEAAAGIHSLALGGSRDGLFYIPKGLDTANPAPLAVMLHGAGANAQQGLSLLAPYADAQQLILLAPDARGRSWDIIATDSFGVDVIFLEQALSQLFECYAIDPSQIAIGGFSDGASYALCLGLSNGDLFTHIIAFSPGFFFTHEKRGKPDVYMSHGVKDAVLPIDPCSRRIARQLQALGYPLLYQEFDGAHEIPTPISKAAVDWFVSPDSRKG